MPLSVDQVNPYDILAMNGASAALMISSIPVPTAVGAVRVGKVDGNFVVYPDEEDLLENTDLDLIVAGTSEAILMVEAGAKEIPEAEILDALDIAHEAIKKLCAAQDELREKAGKPKVEVELPQVHDDLYEEIKASHGAALDAATQVEDKLERQEATKAVEEQILEHYSGDPAADTFDEYRANAQRAFDKLEKTVIRERIAVQKKRPRAPPTRSADRRGRRDAADARSCCHPGQTLVRRAALGTAPRRCGSTLGLETTSAIHHYNFPPFSVGETGRLGGPKRRDIGHGALAERALVPMIPSQEEFPYTIRVVSDILESNGSSSMARVCGSSLSLMDAGVPLKAPVAGIAMGLIKEGDDYIILTDIAGVEDHLGDMDFKVAGTERGITALQMDIKITGVTFEIMRDALSQAKVARNFILGRMQDVIEHPRVELSKYAPRISSIKIDPEKIGLLIGKGGETIRSLQEEFESQIDVNDEGQVLVYAANGELGDALVDRIRSMTKDVEIGDEFTAKVVKTTTFGAFIELAKGTDGLLHISNCAPGRRIATVEEVLNKGDEVNVKVVEVDRERGRIGLGSPTTPRSRASLSRNWRRWRAVAEMVVPGATAATGTVADAATAVDAAAAVTVIVVATAVVTASASGSATATPTATASEPQASSRPSAPGDVRSPSDDARFGRTDRDGGDALRPVRFDRVLDRHRLACRVRCRGWALASAGAPAVQGELEVQLAADRPDLRRDGSRAQRRHRQGVDIGLRASDR